MTTSLFAGVIALAALLEGANFLTGGSLQMAALQKIAQAEQTTTSGTTSSAPATADTSSTTVTPTTTTQPVATDPVPATQPATTQPTTTDTSSGQQTPPPPPPERPVIPQTQGEQQPPQPREGQGGHGGQFSQDVPEREEFFDPREVKQVLREMRDLKSQIKQLTRQVKRLASATDEAATLSKVSGELDQFQSLISSNSQNIPVLRDTIQDFRDNQYWEIMNKIRGKVELPQQLKQIGTSLKRVEKVLANKSVQNVGLDIAKAQSTVAEMRQHYDTVQGLYSSGELEDAMQEMQFFHEGGHPGEIEGTVYRIRDIKNMLKRIKDQTIRAEVDGVLQEVVDKFNAGEYRDARETMDEYADDLQRLVQYFSRSSFRSGPSQDSMNRIRNLENLIKSKLESAGNNAQKGGNQANPFR